MQASSGIADLDAYDVRMAGQLGFTIKHLVIGRDRGDSVELRSHPALIKRSSVFSNAAGSLQ